MHTLGTKVKDNVTGFVGTVTARCEYLNGEPRVAVEGLDTTGRPIEVWAVESRFSICG